MAGPDKSSLIGAIEDAGGEIGTAPGADAGGEVERDLFADAPLLGELQDGTGRRREGPGRPKGARNKSSKEWADFILARYRSPLIGLAEIATTPTAVLAKALKCKLIEAAEFQRKCMSDLAPYIHQKQPTAIQVDERVAGQLVLLLPSADSGQAERTRSAFGLDLEAVEDVEENQEVSEPAPALSHGAKSHEGSK